MVSTGMTPIDHPQLLPESLPAKISGSIYFRSLVGGVDYGLWKGKVLFGYSRGTGVFYPRRRLLLLAFGAKLRFQRWRSPMCCPFSRSSGIRICYIVTALWKLGLVRNA